MWFQHYGAPAHFGNEVRKCVNATFPKRCIGRGGHVAWPPRSPGMTPIGGFFWEHMKSFMNETPVESERDLFARIVDAAGRIVEEPVNIQRLLHV